MLVLLLLGGVSALLGLAVATAWRLPLLAVLANCSILLVLGVVVLLELDRLVNLVLSLFGFVRSGVPAAAS